MLVRRLSPHWAKFTESVSLRGPLVPCWGSAPSLIGLYEVVCSKHVRSRTLRGGGVVADDDGQYGEWIASVVGAAPRLNAEQVARAQSIVHAPPDDLNSFVPGPISPALPDRVNNDVAKRQYQIPAALHTE